MKAGFSIADITPRGRFDLGGFGMRIQPALGIHKNLKARVLLWEAEKTKILLVVCDLIGFTIEESSLLEAELAKAAGVPIANVFLACTHTHSGPSFRIRKGTIGQYSKAYTNQILRALKKAVNNARLDLADINRLRFGQTSTAGMGYFRCATDEPGRKQWRGLLSTLQIQRVAASPITLLSVGMHPLVFGPDNRYVHPDYPGNTCDHWEKTQGGHAMFLTGCGADVHPAPCWTNSENTTMVQECAERIVKRARRALNQGQYLELSPFKARRITPIVRFSFQGPIPDVGTAPWKKSIEKWQKELACGHWPTSSPFPVRILIIGRLALIGLPAEVFHDTGADLARSMPDLHVLTVSQLGGVVGYLPRPFAYRHLTYEAASAHIGYGKAGGMPPGTEERIRNHAVATIRRML